MKTHKFTKLTKIDKIKWLAEHSITEKIINNITDNNEDCYELSQEIYLILLEKPDSLFNNLDYPSIRNLIIKIAKNQYNSVTSPFYKKFKRHQLFKANLDDFDVDSETGEIVPLVSDEE